MYKTLIFTTVLFVLSVHLCRAGEVPFTLEKGLIVVKAKIKKDIPVDVVIATGSPTSYVNMGFVLRNKIQPGYTSDKNGQALIFVSVTQIILGDEKPVSLNMKGSSLESSTEKAGREIAATLGADFFKGKILQIDFKKKVIRFLDAPIMDYKALISIPPSGGMRTLVFPMDQEAETFMGQPVVLPVVDGAVLNGSKVRTLLDTFIPYPVTVSPSAIKQFGFGTVPDKGTTQSSQLKSFNFGGFSIPDIPTILVGKNAGFDEDWKNHAAVLGIAILQNFTVTFDWKEKMVVLER
jgi:hypothetical protein